MKGLVWVMDNHYTKKVKINRFKNFPCMVNEVDTVLPVDGSSDPEVYYRVSGMVRRRTKWGGYDFLNPKGWNRLAVDLGK